MERKVIIVYKSSTGFTKKYAEMIAKELKCPIIDHKTATIEILSQYELVIFGSRAHAGRIDGYKKAKELFEKSRIKNVVLFVTGATPSTAENMIEQFWSQNLAADEMKRIPHFYMPSGLCYEKMSFLDKLMMKAMAGMMKKKKDKTPYEQELEQSIASSYDISSPRFIEPLVEFLKSGGVQ
ncbi:MAG: hypothetical protein HFE75_08640 [Firmicutes bacterium]|jgi:menaquinone-dependent protoporphyrinogen IX oxidase|nr:hypothetical protein [Bacillota bacterium]NBI63588.1 hypothetical protein [Clostridiales bacterium]